jgi:acyl-CoA thioesterase-1
MFLDTAFKLVYVWLARPACHVCAICLVIAVSTTTQAEDMPVDPEVILIMGDSISAAYGMEQSESWPALLSDQLQEHGYSYRVFNSSITGDTTEGGLTRLSRLLEAQKPAIVIVELGGNDGLRGLSLDVTRSNLQAMISRSMEAGASVILAGIQLPPNYGATYTERFAAMYDELATEYGASLIPFILEDIALDPGLMQDDGIHPNVEAQPILLNHVWKVLLPLIEEK